jgi:branched-chain amino acid transport system substrate-binding protein
MMRLGGQGRRRRVRLGGVAGLSVLASVVLLAASACGSSGGSGSSPSAQGGTSTISVGVVADLTGSFAQIQGLSATAGIKAAVDTINAAGGVAGKYKIDLDVVDSASSQSQAVSAARQLVAAKPDVIIGALDASEVPAISQLIASADIPTFYMNTTTNLVYPGQPYIYAVATEAPQGNAAQIDGAKQALGGSLAGKKIALEGNQDPEVTEGFSMVSKLLAEQGATVVSVQYTPATMTSFATQAAQIVAERANAVISLDTASNTSIVTKALRTAGFNGPIVTSSNAISAAVLESIADPGLQAALEVAPTTPDTPLGAAGAKYGQDVSGAFASFGWATVYAIDAVESACKTACGGDSFNKIISDTTVNIPGDVLFGPLKFSATSHDGDSAAQVYEYDPATKGVVKFGSPMNTDVSASD